MAQVNFSRDPRIKRPIVHVVSDDDEDRTPASRMPVVSKDVIELDSESEDDEQGSTFKSVHHTKPIEGIILVEDNKPDKDVSFGGDIKLDKVVELGQYGEHYGHSQHREPDEYDENMSLCETDEDSMMDEDSERFEHDYDYEADHLLGGPMEMLQVTTRVAPKSIDYADLMNKSYHKSRSRNLSYQYHLENKNIQAEYQPSTAKRPRIEIPDDITSLELDRILRQVSTFTSRGEPDFPSDVFQYTGYRRSESFCQESFEKAIGLYHRTPQRPIPNWISMQKTISVRSLLGLRELGRARTPLIKDQILLYMTKSYRPVTSFNFSSGSVVDVALKPSTMKLAIANIATQDTYNRKGNLFLCDLNKGFSKKLEGHTRFDQRLNQEMEVTVNDIKLSNSQNFFISGSDDHKTMIWNAETGALMNTIGEHTSRVTRVAIVEHARDGQDVFATGSADGTIKIYALDNEGLISVGNGVLNRNGFTGKRCISSISFGYNHFWDCLAVGFEGADGQDGVGARQGLIAIYDANTIQKVMDGDLGYRHGAQRSTEKSVSCLSFSPSGSQLVCGTSGRSSAEDDEKGDKMIRVIDLQTSKMVESAVSGHEDVNLVDFSPCMRYLISGSNTNETAVFDRRNLKRALHRLCHSPRDDDQGHAGITSALWWPSSCGTSQSMLMTGGGDETVRLWDLRRASEDTEIWSMDTNIGPIARMIAPSSMEHLIVGSDTGAVNIYSIDDGMVAKYKNNGMTLLNDDET
ncbi:hypothetical protein BGZ95_002084 [Linnemannia exigua]|uniref:WD40 repeat-like protein n=1 Tax=Linnemannia exigua TaxID=604196 RepID=A0AAD4DIY1_9FUNG|nr:hypothetical protein BGZ95_002084 [Linnemannia exigua]